MKETLNKSGIVIANAAKQSITRFPSRGYGSPRHYAPPRDGGFIQCNLKRMVALLLIALALSACNRSGLDPYDTVIPQDEAAWNVELMPAIKKLGEPDQKLLTEYLARAKGTSPGKAGVPSGMTIGGAIAEQRKFNEKKKKAAEARALKEKLEKERAERNRKPEDAIGIKVVNIEVMSDEYYPSNQELLCQLAIRNTGKRDISGVTGRVYFYDADKEVAHLAIRFDGGVKANSVAQMRWKQDYNQYSDEDRALAGWATGKYKSVFIPESIVFADGEKLILLE